MKRLRPVDAAILLGLVAVGFAFYLRVRHPDLVSSRLTDLARRETVRVVVVVPMPWTRPPLSELPKAGDAETGAGGRDSAVFVALERDTGPTVGAAWPRAVFDVTARVDREGRRWFNYAEVIAGANFAFHVEKYSMAGIVIEVKAPEPQG